MLSRRDSDAARRGGGAASTSTAARANRRVADAVRRCRTPAEGVPTCYDVRARQRRRPTTTGSARTRTVTRLRCDRREKEGTDTRGPSK